MCSSILEQNKKRETNQRTFISFSRIEFFSEDYQKLLAFFFSRPMEKSVRIVSVKKKTRLLENRCRHRIRSFCRLIVFVVVFVFVIVVSALCSLPKRAGVLILLTGGRVERNTEGQFLEHAMHFRSAQRKILLNTIEKPFFRLFSVQMCSKSLVESTKTSKCIHLHSEHTHIN